MHPRAGHRLVDVEQVLALAERVEERRHPADVERVRADPQQVVEDARDLVEHHADVLRAHRHLDAEQPLDREAVGVLVAHHRHVVEPVHVRQRLQVRPVLGELLGRAVQQPDVRIGALDHLAVELEHEPQHAVRRRVLRPKIHRVIADLGHLTAVADEFRCRLTCASKLRPKAGRSQNSSCNCGSRPSDRIGAGAPVSPASRVGVLADDPRRDLARLDRHRLVDRRAPAPGRSASRRARRSGSPCGTDARRSRSR